MAQKRNPARLVIALSVAAVLAVFLLYTSIAGGGTPSVAPSELAGKTGVVTLVGHVQPGYKGDSYGGGLRFRLRDREGTSQKTVTVALQGLGVRPVPRGPRRLRRGRAPERHLRREEGLARDEVPVEVHGEEELLTCLSWAAPRSSPRSGSPSTRSSPASIAAWKRRRRLALSAQNALIGAFATSAVASVVLLAALVRHDFSFVYVAQHTSRELPTGYTISAFWGGQEGSLLLWLLILTGYGAAAVLLNRADARSRRLGRPRARGRRALLLVPARRRRDAVRRCRRRPRTAPA